MKKNLNDHGEAEGSETIALPTLSDLKDRDASRMAHKIVLKKIASGELGYAEGEKIRGSRMSRVRRRRRRKNEVQWKRVGRKKGE